MRGAKVSDNRHTEPLLAFSSKAKGIGAQLKDKAIAEHCDLLPNFAPLRMRGSGRLPG
jgi:hypothetical protein